MVKVNQDLPPAPPGYTAQEQQDISQEQNDISHGPNGVAQEQRDVPKPDIVYSPHPQPAYSQQASYVTPLERLRDQPEWVDCPFCRKVTKTRVDKEDSGMTMLAGGLLCLVCICLACLPCILGWAQHVNQYCTSCGKQLTHQPYDSMITVTPAAREAQRAVETGVPPGPSPGQVQSRYSQNQGETHQAPAVAPVQSPQSPR